jgi:dTDP-4-dehydrorhamnose reductase
VPRLLVTGASGLLGAHLVLAAQRRCEVIAVCHQHSITRDGVRTEVADLTRPAEAHALLNRVRPEWVIHCAAEADVDRCERDPDRATLMNVEMAAHVAEASRRIGARLVHISTDAVFDGKSDGYREDDPPNPVNVYGRTKLEGERAVTSAHPEALVLRTNFFGWHPQGPRGLAEWFLERLEADLPAPGFADVFVSPLSAGDLAELILKLLPRPALGIYHGAGSACLSKFEFGRELASRFGFDRERVQPTSVDEAGLLAPRPRRLCLDSSRLTADTGWRPKGAAEGLSAMRRQRDDGFRDQLKSLMSAEATA